MPGPVGTALEYAETYRVVNKYHVFPTMKTERIELELWGSINGVEWQQYEFKYKPGNVGMRPSVAILFQPRLDWQMWFVTLGPVHMPWFQHFLRALLNNSPPVTALLRNNPFASRAPRFIRVYAYRYEFAGAEQRVRTGQWWRREFLGPFGPLPWLSQ